MHVGVNLCYCAINGVCDHQKRCESHDIGHLNTNDYENLQHVFSEAPLPFSLVEEIVEVAAKGDENKAKSKESKYT